LLTPVGTHRRNALLAAYFAKTSEAADNLRKLRKHGFRRTALLHKDTEGVMRARDPFLARRMLVAALSPALLGIACAAAALPLNLPPLTLGVTGAFAGFLAGWLSNRRLRHGIAGRILKEHARWLVSDETVLVIQAAVDTLPVAVAMLREGGDVPPAVYVQRPKGARPATDLEAGRAPLLPAQVRENAERLALEHAIGRGPRHGSEVIQRLREARQAVREVCRELAQAVRMEQGTPPTAVWILDNEYVLESNARDVQANLPAQFVRQLPSLQSGRSAGLPRIYDIALELVTDVELRLDKENVSSFVQAYQAGGTLAIGELWALPQMLRVAIIENIRSIASRASAELQEREIADFWAGRLIRANRRSPEQLFAFLAELAAAQPVPSPYLAGHLVGQLYDEEAALVLVQGWLERVYRQPLREVNLREQNRQTRDQISIGNAFASLRHLALLDWRQIFEQTSHV
jgi:cyclic beta-1,2-glucan synthetase